MIWIVLRKKFGCSGAEFYLEYFELAQVSDLHKRFQIHQKISFMVDLNWRDISLIRRFSTVILVIFGIVNLRCKKFISKNKLFDLLFTQICIISCVVDQ